MKKMYQFIYIILALGVAQVQPYTVSCEHDINSPRITQFGELKEWQYCKEGHYAYGGRGHWQRKQGNDDDKDDFGLTGLQLYCGKRLKDNSIEHVHNIYYNFSPGTWDQLEHFCPDNKFINGFQLKSEPYQYGDDDTGASNIRLYCSDYPDPLYLTGIYDWGDWTDTQYCKDGYAVCGVRVDFEYGSSDDTGVNNVDMHCCKLP